MKEAETGDSGTPRVLSAVTTASRKFYPPTLLARALRWIGRSVVALSVTLNILILVLLAKFLLTGTTWTEDSSLHEHLYSGKTASGGKVAVIRIAGVLMEGVMGFFRQQIDAAAADDAVRAVVVRIESPGGTITASDDILRRLCQLREGNPAKQWRPKPLIVSMGSIAASGGYYIAMASERLFAERSTITGSIGVYAAFPNVTELAGKYGIKMNVIKAGRVKDSGSMFHEMTPQEQQVWQDLIDHAYQQFLAVVQEGRAGRLRYPLLADIAEEAKPASGPHAPEAARATMARLDSRRYPRQLADGGIFTADKAKQYGLVDEIGYLEDAIAAARTAASLDEDCAVVTYERQQPILINWLLGDLMARTKTSPFELGRLAQAFQPRLWYLAPENEVAGLLAAASNP